jgi:hypothetical protein
MEQSWTIYVHLKGDGYSPREITASDTELQAIMENVREHGIMVIGGKQSFYYPHDSISFIDAYKQDNHE